MSKQNEKKKIMLNYKINKEKDAKILYAKIREFLQIPMIK